MEVEDSEIENITVGDFYAIVPIVILISAIAIFVAWLQSLFGYDNDNKEVSFRKQYREYRKNERKIMRQYK